VLDVLREHVRAGIPAVGMEPSCLAVFKDELLKLLPHDDDAKRLAANSYHFAEFFQTFDVAVPALHEDSLLWTHCHQRATGGSTAEQGLLERMGMTVRPLAGGCCGLAGSWGFEAGKHQISMDCGEQALLPAIRDASPETLIVADGFSCKTQIADAATGRQGLHVAEVMARARAGQAQRNAPAAKEPSEQGRPTPPALGRVARTAGPLLAVGGAAFAAARWSITRRASRAGRRRQKRRKL
jgi:Fe-S oxidoreductase